MKGKRMLLTALTGLGLVAPVMGVNLLSNPSFEVDPFDPNLPPNSPANTSLPTGYEGTTQRNSTIHQPGGAIPDGVQYGSVQAGGAQIENLGNHAPVATSGVGAKQLTFTGLWGGGTTCALQGGGCANISKRTGVMRILDGDALGSIAAEVQQVIDMGVGDDPNIPSGFDWTAFNLQGTVSTGQATVQFGWVQGNGQWSDGTGIHFDKLDLSEGVVGPDVKLVSAVSERTHGAAGPFGSTANLSGTNTVEPRQNGTTPKMILSFDAAPVATDGTFTCGGEVVVTNGTCNSVSVSGNDLTVNMTFNKNQCVKVALSGITGLTGDSDVSVVAHEGNANLTSGVNILDLQAIKNQLNQSANIINYNLDVTVNGSINILDLQATKNNLNVAAGACP